MSVSVMEKLTVIVPKAESDALLRALMRLRCVSHAPLADGDGIPPPEADVAGATARVARIAAVLPALTKKSKRKKRLFATTPYVSADFLGEARDTRAWKTVTETERLLQRQSELRAAIEASDERIAALTPYLAFPLPLSFRGTDTTCHLLGRLPAGIRAERAEAALDELAAEVFPINRDAGGTYLSVLVHNSQREDAERALGALGFTPAPFTDEDSPAAVLMSKEKEVKKDLEDELERAGESLSLLAENLDDVEILYDIERTTLLAEQSKQQLAATRECTVLSLWCPRTAQERVQKVLTRFGAAFAFAPPDEGDEPPVLLRNNGFARNFEWVLGMYAYPKYGRFDPTFLMSIFYFLIFGLMFADAGYGVVMSLACFLAVRYLKPREGMKRFLLMFGYCGISSILFGVLFGSYFGNFPLAFLENVVGLTPEQMPNLSRIATAQANLALLFDPLQNPMAFLVISLGVGALHLLAGMAVRAYILCRDRHPLAALFDIGSYYLLFAGLITLFFQKNVGLWLTVGGVAAILLTQGRHRKGFFGKVVGGLGGLYNLIGYASDLLSYSRVLALGLAAGVIGQVVNILATLNGNSFVGFLLMIVIFVIGHLLNLVINVLGTFVHTARLQYIEFFGKFYEDGGTPFVPIAPSDRYSSDTSPERDSAE